MLIEISSLAIAYSGMRGLVASEPEEWKQVVVRSLAATIFRVPSKLLLSSIPLRLVVDVAFGPAVFTSDQIQSVHALLESDSTVAGSSSDVSTFSSAPISTPPPVFHDDSAYMYNPDFMPSSHAWSPFDAIADELGVERHLVQAVVERLANCSLV